MKKIMLLLMTCALAILVGCKEKSFNLDNAITTLQDNGYVIVQHDDTKEELEMANSILTTEITGLSHYQLFDFNIVEFIAFSPNSETTLTINFIRFENASQAKSYYKYKLDTRSETNKWRQQVIDNVVISSIDENANSLLSLSVK